MTAWTRKSPHLHVLYLGRCPVAYVERLHAAHKPATWGAVFNLPVPLGELTEHHYRIGRMWTAYAEGTPHVEPYSCTLRASLRGAKAWADDRLATWLRLSTSRAPVS